MEIMSSSTKTTPNKHPENEFGKELFYLWVPILVWKLPMVFKFAKKFKVCVPIFVTL